MGIGDFNLANILTRFQRFKELFHRIHCKSATIWLINIIAQRIETSQFLNNR